MDYLKATWLNLIVNLVYALVAVVVGVLAVWLIDRFLYPKVDFQEEINKGNVAAAIFAAAMLLFVALLLMTAMSR